MWPAPCSWRTRMCRIELSRIGSYAGRMQPPGSPNMTSTFSISRLLMRACAPVSFIVRSFFWPGKLERPPEWEAGARARGGAACLRDDYEEVAAGHGVDQCGSVSRFLQPPHHRPPGDGGCGRAPVR